MIFKKKQKEINDDINGSADKNCDQTSEIIVPDLMGGDDIHLSFDSENVDITESVSAGSESSVDVPDNGECSVQKDIAAEDVISDIPDNNADSGMQIDESSDNEFSETEEMEPLNDFEASIKNFTLDDAEPAVETRGKSFDILRVFILVVCICVCSVSSYILIRNIHDKIKSEQIYGDIINSVADGFNVDGGVVSNGGKITLLVSDSKTAYTPTMDEIIKNGVGEITTPSDYSAELAKMRASLESLKNINPEIYAWIKIPGTNINYPVAQTDNNEYYLDHAYTGDNLVNGSIYADFRCDDLITKNYNTVLYGHNITSGSMFNNVTEFFKPEVFENTLIYIYTFDGIFIFKPFSIHEAAYDSGYVDMAFYSPEEFIAFAGDLAEMSDIKADIEFTGNDRILTLSTCTNGISTQRYALHAVLVQTIIN